MTPAEANVIKVATDVAEVGHNVGFENLASVVIHELYEAVEALKREKPMRNPGETDHLSTDERARRFKWAIAEYARAHREYLKQADDLETATANVERLKRETENARGRVIELLGDTTYLDFHEALYWRFVEHGWTDRAPE